MSEITELGEVNISFYDMQKGKDPMIWHME